MSTSRVAALSRRSFLAGTLTGVAAAALGCGARDQAERAPATLATLVGATPFAVAHRGGGDNWPEMTAYAYEKAAALPGLHAIEISVCLSADGVLVCSHDASTLRTTGVDLEISAHSWAELSGLEVTSAYTTDPTQPARPLSRLDEVVAAHIGTLVTFVEPKTPQTVGPLMAAMVALGQPERVVWKQPVNQPHFAEAKAHGFGTWGYVLDEQGHLGANLERFSASPTIDLLGAPASKPDRFVTTVVETARRHGKETIMWPVRDVAGHDRALRLGCAGLMSSNVLDVR